MEVFRTFHQQADASVSYAISSISSIKSVEITCRWLNEMPLVNRILAYYSPDDDVYLGAFVTDDVGHAPKDLITDWYMTTSKSYTRSIIKPLLNIGGGKSLNSTEPIQLDQDVNKVVYFGDFEVPQVTITIPTADHIQNTTDLDVTGTASDVISGVVLVQFSLDPNPDWSLKSWTGATGTDDWTFTLTDLPEGVHTIYVRAFDYANSPDGIHGNATVGGITVDMTDPVINVSYPTETGVEVTNLPTVLIEGNVSEEIDELSVMGELIPLTGTSFSHTVILVAGENIIVITTTDMVGNVGTWSEHVVIYDPVLPVITITAPASGALLNTTSVIVQGFVDEAVRDDQVVINGIAVTLSDGTFEHLLIDLDEGPLTIGVSAIDLAGNLANAAIDISVDSISPVLEITYPTNGLLTREAAVEILGTISEAGAAISISGPPYTVEGTEWSLSYILVEGVNTIVVVARDAANNMGSASIVVTLDTIAPFLELAGLDKGTITTGEDVVAVYGSTEPGASVVMVVSGTEITASVNPDGSFIHTFTITELETLITVRAEDLVGNGVSEDVLIYRKQTEVPDKVPVLTPEQATWVAAVTTSALIVGVLVSLEFTRYALLLLFIPLYARLKKDAVLDNKTRLALHGLIVENPGMHYNEIIREFNLTNGVAAYHLDVLEREGFLRSVRDGTLRRFYSTTSKVPQDHKLTPDQVRERILLLVTDSPGISQKAIVDELGIGRTLVGYHLKTLIDDGYLKASKQGRFTVYSRTNKRWFQAT
ncbi:MAG: winged helix-turn-helix transcriptional regulator [Thermoplasmata archaeon]|nr:winged helix-turn-helix transcriptional regulator [Thermoplasmata archaeon]